MVRFVIIGIVLGVAFTIYTIIDAAMSDPRRARGVGKHIWVLLCVVLPVIGGILWLTLGKGPESTYLAPKAPDDDPLFGDMSQEEMDKRISDLEQQLNQLDQEVYPGENAADKRAAEDSSADESAGREAAEREAAESEVSEGDDLGSSENGKPEK